MLVHCRTSIAVSEVRLTRDSYLVSASTTDLHQHQSRQMISVTQLYGPQNPRDVPSDWRTAIPSKPCLHSVEIAYIGVVLKC